MACRIENVTLHPADTGLSPPQGAAAQATSAVQNASWGLVTNSLRQATLVPLYEQHTEDPPTQARGASALIVLPRRGRQTVPKLGLLADDPDISALLPAMT